MIRTRVRIREGVGRGLCGTCEHGHIRIDDRGEQRVYCSVNWNQPAHITRAIVECTDHQDRHAGMSKHECERLGWVLTVTPVRGIGFSGADPDVRFDRPKKKTADDDDA